MKGARARRILRILRKLRPRRPEEIENPRRRKSPSQIKELIVCIIFIALAAGMLLLSYQDS